MFDMRDLLARFRELSSMNFMSYFRPTEAKQTKSHLIMKKVIDGHRYAFVYRPYNAHVHLLRKVHCLDLLY